MVQSLKSTSPTSYSDAYSAGSCGKRSRSPGAPESKGGNDFTSSKIEIATSAPNKKISPSDRENSHSLAGISGVSREFFDSCRHLYSNCFDGSLEERIAIFGYIALGALYCTDYAPSLVGPFLAMQASITVFFGAGAYLFTR